MKKTIIILLPLIAFLFGVSFHRYQLFPYEHLQSALIWIDKHIKGSEDVQFVRTQFHRLLIKGITIELDYKPDLHWQGGAITSLGQYLFISTNRMDEFREHINVFDMKHYTRIDTRGLSIPMNYTAMLNSSIIDIPDFESGRFRVSGLYAEITDINTIMLYVTHNKYHTPDQCISFRLSSIEIEIKDEVLHTHGDWETLFTANPCLFPEHDQHGYEPFSGQLSGGPMVRFDDEHILISVGSFHRDGIKHQSLPMDPSSPFGKLILFNKLNREYTIFAKGLRNAQGLYIDGQQIIWATDHGPMNGDKLLMVNKGDNYGWPEMTYGLDYFNRPWPNSTFQGRVDGYTEAHFVWNSIAPVNLTSVKGSQRFFLWKNDLIIASLRNQSLHRIRLAADNRVLYSESILIGKRIRGITTLYDERIALLTDDGYLILIDDGGLVYQPTDKTYDLRVTELKKLERLNN